MLPIFARVVLAAFVACAATAQTAPASATFEAADIHVSPRSTNPVMRVAFPGGRYTVHTATLLDLVGLAWDVDVTNIVGGPGWLDVDRFDVVAKASANTSNDVLRSMLRTLLAARFQLEAHNDNRMRSAWVLTIVKLNPQVKAAEGTGAKGCDRIPPDSPSVSQAFACHNMTMKDFAGQLRNLGPAVGYVGNLPIVDQTNLTGAWDFTFKYSFLAQRAYADGEGVTLFNAIDKQMGMKLEMKKVSAPVLVVDSANRTFTPNAPGLSDKLPLVKMEFDVADIKISAPDTEDDLAIRPGGRFNAKGTTLRQLLEFATLADAHDMLVGPKWIDEAKFDIVAKAPADAQNLSDDDLREMLRSLLVDRFKLTSHVEDRPASVYLLTAPKPKLKKADDSNRSACIAAGAAPGKPASSGLKLFNCQNMTMEFFGQTLRKIARGYIDHPVVEATGLDGAYDFDLMFSARFVAEAARRSVEGGVLDPDGAISLSDALDKQLGLKLELQKHPMPVMVIDHIEEKPTDN